MTPKQCIILGGGYSIKKGINLGLWDKIKDRFVIGTNYDYLFVDTTFTVCSDLRFLKAESKKERFKKLPLILAKEHSCFKYLPNMIPVRMNDTQYYRDIKLGCYKSMTGIMALSIAIYLLDVGTIFLLGMDNNGEKIDNTLLKDAKGRFLTHWYHNLKNKEGDIINHAGIGKINYYHDILIRKHKTYTRQETDYKPFEEENKCKIYNVSPNSLITSFPKLSYAGFFNMLDNISYNQDNLRKEVLQCLK